MSLRRLLLTAILSTCSACNGSSPAGGTGPASSATQAVSARPSAPAATTAAPAPPPPRATAAPKPPPPPPFLGNANQVSLLGTSGLQVAPPFRYKLNSFDVFWKVEDAADDGQSIYLMRKAFPADRPVGEVVPCADKSEGTGKQQPDGSFIYKCRARGSSDGTWFGRILPNHDGMFDSLICTGSSRDEKWLRQIEAVCRSIKPKK